MTKLFYLMALLLGLIVAQGQQVVVTLPTSSATVTGLEVDPHALPVATTASNLAAAATTTNAEQTALFAAKQTTNATLDQLILLNLAGFTNYNELDATALAAIVATNTIVQGQLAGKAATNQNVSVFPNDAGYVVGNGYTNSLGLGTVGGFTITQSVVNGQVEYFDFTYLPTLYSGGNTGLFWDGSITAAQLAVLTNANNFTILPTVNGSNMVLEGSAPTLLGTSFSGIPATAIVGTAVTNGAMVSVLTDDGTYLTPTDSLNAGLLTNAPGSAGDVLFNSAGSLVGWTGTGNIARLDIANVFGGSSQTMSNLIIRPSQGITVGTSAQAAGLYIYAGAGQAAGYHGITFNSTTNVSYIYPGITSYRSRGAGIGQASGDTLYGDGYNGYDGAANGNAANFSVKTRQAWTNGSHGAGFSFYGVPTNTTSLVESFQTDADANLRALRSMVVNTNLTVGANITATGYLIAAGGIGIPFNPINGPSHIYLNHTTGTNQGITVYRVLSNDVPAASISAAATALGSNLTYLNTNGNPGTGVSQIGATLTFGSATVAPLGTPQLFIANLIGQNNGSTSNEWILFEGFVQAPTNAIQPRIFAQFLNITGPTNGVQPNVLDGILVEISNTYTGQPWGVDSSGIAVLGDYQSSIGTYPPMNGVWVGGQNRFGVTTTNAFNYAFHAGGRGSVIMRTEGGRMTNSIIGTAFFGEQYNTTGLLLSSAIAGAKAIVVADGAGIVQVGTNGLQVGGGSTQTFFRIVSASLDFGSVAAGGQAELNVNVPGAATNDVVSIGCPAVVSNNLYYTGYVSISETVTVRCLNNNLLTAIDPASQTFKVKVER